MNSENKPVNRKTGRLIAKNAIILTVLIAVCSLSIWAWLTKGSTAIADGINVRSRADGFEVSWNGEDYYDNLQALSESDVVKGVNGLAKNISGIDGEPLKLSLITGNGVDFFEPYLNRRTGTHLVKDTVTNQWSGIDVDASNSEGKYVDIHLYFRGTSEKSVYLMGDSEVSPKSTLSTVRPSEYGNFTRDYIAAASRIAFLDVTESKDDEGNTVVNHDCKFIWAPNADIELQESADGYVKYKDTDVETISVTTGGDYDLDGFGCSEVEGKTFYLWSYKDSGMVEGYPDTYADFKSDFTARAFRYDTKLGCYVVDVTLYVPNYNGNNNPTIPFFVNETNLHDNVDFNNFNTYILGGASNSLYDKYSEGQYFNVTDTEFTVSGNKCTNGFKISDSKYAIGDKITFTAVYDYDDKYLAILNYSVNDKEAFSRGEAETTTTTEVTYFPLPDDTNCALVNPKESVAISSGTHNFKAIQFSNIADKNNVLAVSVTLNEQFTAEIKGSGATATYKFKNNKSGKYLTLTSEGASLTTAGSEFSLYYDKDFESPILKSGDYFLVFKNGKLAATTLDALNTAEAITIYTGSSYQLLTNQTTSNEVFTYYNSKGTTPGIVNLSSTSTPPLFTTSCYTPATQKVSDIAITTLKRSEAVEEDNKDDASSEETDEDVDNFDYYTSHIIMRVWVEGTDREAKTPLADGIFNMSLHFTSY